MSSGVREFRVWQESVALAGDVIRAARQGMRRETKAVSESLMTTALSVATYIADAYGRATPAEQREAYHQGKRALLRLETELAVSKHADLIPAGSFTELAARAGQVAKLLGGYLAYLDRQLLEAESRGSSAGAPPVGDRRPISPGSVRAPS